jgi:hypothetical protein
MSIRLLYLDLAPKNPQMIAGCAVAGQLRIGLGHPLVQDRAALLADIVEASTRVHIQLVHSCS